MKDKYDKIADVLSERVFNSIFQTINEVSDRVYIIIREAVIEQPLAKSHAINGYLTINVASKACPGLEVKDGRLKAPMKFGRQPCLLDIPLTGIITFADGYGVFSIEFGFNIYVREEATPEEVTKPDKPKLTAIQGGKVS